MTLTVTVCAEPNLPCLRGLHRSAVAPSRLHPESCLRGFRPWSSPCRPCLAAFRERQTAMEIHAGYQQHRIIKRRPACFKPPASSAQAASHGGSLESSLPLTGTSELWFGRFWKVDTAPWPPTAGSFLTYWRTRRPSQLLDSVSFHLASNCLSHKAHPLVQITASFPKRLERCFDAPELGTILKWPYLSNLGVFPIQNGDRHCWRIALAIPASIADPSGRASLTPNCVLLPGLGS